MLNTTLQKTITGTSMIGTEIAATMSGTIHENGTMSISMNVVNNKVYKEKKDEVRADMESFKAAVYAEEGGEENEQSND